MLYTVSKNKIQSSDHALLIMKFRLKLKKAEKTIRPFRYDLNQSPYDYTNRFKGLDLIDRVTEELWAEINITVQEAVNRTIPRNRNGKKQNGCLKR